MFITIALILKLLPVTSHTRERGTYQGFFKIEIKITLNFRIVRPCIVTDSLRIKPTDALKSSFIGITILHVSGSLSAHHQEFLAYIGFGTFYAVVMTVCYQE